VGASNAVFTFLHGVVCGLVAVPGTVCVREGSVTAAAVAHSLGRRVLAEHPVCTSRAQVYSMCSSYEVWIGAVASTVAASTAGRFAGLLAVASHHSFRVWVAAAAGSVGLAVTLRLQAGVSRQALGSGVSVCEVCGPCSPALAAEHAMVVAAMSENSNIAAVCAGVICHMAGVTRPV